MRALWVGVVVSIFLSHVFALADHSIATLAMKRKDHGTVDLGGVASRYTVTPKAPTHEQVGTFNMEANRGSGTKIKYRFRTHSQKRK